MEKTRTATNHNRFTEEAGYANGDQPIQHITIRTGVGRYKHYLDCPLLGKMIHIKGQTSVEISSDTLDKAIQRFKTLLENKKGPH